MKKVIFFLAISVSLSAAAKSKMPSLQECALKAEQYVSTGYSQPAELISSENDQLIFRVLTIENGGNAALSVSVDSRDCSLISFETLWSE